MDGILNFFKEFRDRFSSPLFSSFIIAWLFLNWQVPLYLFFYDFDKLKIDGYLSYHDMIAKNVTTNSGVCFPILSALIYTFIFPVFRQLNIASNAFYKKWGNKWYFSISEESSIPYTKYIELRNTHDKLSKELSNIISQDKKNLADVFAFQQQLNDSNTKTSELLQARMVAESKVYEWENGVDVNRLNGSWHFRTLSPNFNISGQYIALNGELTKFNETKPSYNISVYLKNPNTKKLTLVLNAISEGKRTETYHWLDLNATTNADEYIGRVNNYEITMSKIYT